MNLPEMLKNATSGQHMKILNMVGGKR